MRRSIVAMLLAAGCAPLAVALPLELLGPCDDALAGVGTTIARPGALSAPVDELATEAVSSLGLGGGAAGFSPQIRQMIEEAREEWMCERGAGDGVADDRSPRAHDAAQLSRTRQGNERGAADLCGDCAGGPRRHRARDVGPDRRLAGGRPASGRLASSSQPVRHAGPLRDDLLKRLD